MSGGPRVLVVDDEARVRDLIRRTLESSYDVVTADDGEAALAAIRDPETRPDLVLLDVRMPGLDGYEVCARIQTDHRTADIPVVFVTGLDSEQDRARAFEVGAAAYLEKPFDREVLLSTVAEHTDTGARWREVKGAGARQPSWLMPSTFTAFKEYLLEQRNASSEQAQAFAGVGPDKLYEIARLLNIPDQQLTGYLARFLSLPYVQRFQADDLSLSMLPRSFCASNSIVPLADGTVVVTNPFDWELMDALERTLWRNEKPRIALGDPDRIRALYRSEEDEPDSAGPGVAEVISLDRAVEEEGQEIAEAQVLANDLLRGALAERASDLHIEPKERGALIRYRIDGDLQDVRTIKPKTAARLISRLKALAGMDIAEKRKPQDGGLEVTLGDRRLRLRLATSATGHGETLVVRILEPETDPVPLEDLGMTDGQADEIRELATRDQGMILVVGPTGSGKSTTIFTILAQVDARTRSILSVEDPIEYQVPYANQQQVNERAGVTFESLLRSAMRQDPDILFLGEVRDPFSARAVLDFASSGHLTISSLHSSNATTAIFRLERLGVERGAIADSVTAVVAQKILKKLCTECREVGPPTPEERALLAHVTDEIPEQVARSVGCPACRETGYWGREGVFEVLRLDREVSRRVREGRGIAEIRSYCAQRGDYLISDHALQKVRDLVFSVQDAYEAVLIEEQQPSQAPAGATSGSDAGDGQPAASTPAEEPAPARDPEEGPAPDDLIGARSAGTDAPGPDAALRVLVVDDDPDIRTLVRHHLTAAGYEVILATDGIEALMELGQQKVDAVLSDINMPNLDGIKLMEMLHQKGVSVPAVFLTGAEDDSFESQVLGLGAADYIRKPVRKEVLLMRLRNAIHGGAPTEPVSS